LQVTLGCSSPRAAAERAISKEKYTEQKLNWSQTVDVIGKHELEKQRHKLPCTVAERIS